MQCGTPCDDEGECASGRNAMNDGNLCDDCFAANAPAPTPEPATPGSGGPCGAMFRWIPCCDPQRRTHADACDLPRGHTQMAHGKAHLHAAAPPPTQGPGEEEAARAKVRAEVLAEAVMSLEVLAVKNKDGGTHGETFRHGIRAAANHLRDRIARLSTVPPVPGETPTNTETPKETA